MIISLALTKIKSIILFLINRFRRALCCFRKRRRASCELEPLTYVGVVSNQTPANDLEKWSDWNDSDTVNNIHPPSSVQEHIEHYRQQKLLLASQPTSVEIQQDFFEDMTPRITRQTKLLINTNDGGNMKNNFSLVPDTVNVNGELTEWEENSGWEGQTQDWDVQEALRETKKLERERKMWEQQQRRLERSTRPISLGAKIIS